MRKIRIAFFDIDGTALGNFQRVEQNPVHMRRIVGAVPHAGEHKILKQAECRSIHNDIPFQNAKRFPQSLEPAGEKIVYGTAA